jgi:hypothetical protein
VGSIYDEVIRIPRLTLILGFTQPLTEMSTRNLPGVKARPTLKADKFTANWEPIV